MATALHVVFLISCCGMARGLRVIVTDPIRGPHVPNGRPSRLHCKHPFAPASAPASATSMSSESGSSSTEGAQPLGFGSRAARRRKGGIKRRTPDSPDSLPPSLVLKRSSRWACVKGCGACCYLAPSERPDLAEYLPDPKELELYMSMAADDGWCKHFDKETRGCTIYEDRPRFCRVETETFGDMYGVEPEEMDDFCTSCCDEQIGDVYGVESKEMRVFKAALAALERGERPMPELSPFGGDPAGGEQKQIRDWGIPETAADRRRRRR